MKTISRYHVRLRSALRTARVAFSIGLSLTAIVLLALIFQISNSRAQVVSAQQPQDYAQLKLQAERLFADASYARANELYGRISKTGLSPEELRWVEFRLADTQWR